MRRHTSTCSITLTLRGWRLAPTPSSPWTARHLRCPSGSETGVASAGVVSEGACSERTIYTSTGSYLGPYGPLVTSACDVKHLTKRRRFPECVTRRVNPLLGYLRWFRNHVFFELGSQTSKTEDRLRNAIDPRKDIWETGKFPRLVFSEDRHDPRRVAAQSCRFGSLF